MAALAFTFDAAKHLYHNAEGLVVPSVTQALKASGLINFDHVPPRVLERKRQLGTLVHQAAALYDQGVPYVEIEMPDIVAQYLEGYIMFRTDTGFTPSLIEEAQLGAIFGMVYGMTPDRAGMLNDEMHVIELKCGAAADPAWGVQLAAYVTGKFDRAANVKRAALQLGPDFSRGYKLHPYDDRSDFQVWQCSLALTIWQQNKGKLRLEGVDERLIAA